jgi:large subunit ribosomal protein L9
VTAKDLAEALERKAFSVDRRKTQLEEPIKTLGEFQVPVKLHKSVTATLKVIVTREE